MAILYTGRSRAPADSRLLSRHQDSDGLWNDSSTLRLHIYPQSLSAICAPQLTSLPQKKLESGQYPSLTEFEADMELVFTNCFTYNLPGSDIFIMAETLRKVFREQLADLVYSHQHMTAAESTPTEPAASPKPRTNKPKSMRPPS